MSIEIPLSGAFSLDHTLGCGQAFRWYWSEDGFWYGIVGKVAVRTTQEKNRLMIEYASDMGVDEKFFTSYFGLEDDLERIYASINRDEHIGRAIRAYRGLRILRQDPWETLASYTLATFVNIKRIKKMIEGLCRQYGDRLEYMGRRFYTFPSPKAFSSAHEGLEGVRLGYRAQNLLDVAGSVASDPTLLIRVSRLGYEEAREVLLSKKGLRPFRGVGDKVADCVLLFGFGMLRSFPVDVWVARSIVDYYPNLFNPPLIEKIRVKVYGEKKGSLTASEYNTLRRRMTEYFGEYAGYAQQYLFTYRRGLK